MSSTLLNQTYNAKDYLTNKDLDRMMEHFGECAELSGAGTARVKIDPLTGKPSIVQPYQWEIVDQLYNEKKKLLNRNIEDLKPTLKPIAKDLYFDRKVEYINLMDIK